MTKQKYFKKKIINQTEVDAFTQKQNECLKIGDVEWVKNIIQKFSVSILRTIALLHRFIVILHLPIPL